MQPRVTLHRVVTTNRRSTTVHEHFPGFRVEPFCQAPGASRGGTALVHSLLSEGSRRSVTHFPTHKHRTSVCVAFVQLLATSECLMTIMSESFRNAFAPKNHQARVYCAHMQTVASLSRGISSKTCSEEDIMTFCPAPHSMRCTFSMLSFEYYCRQKDYKINSKKNRQICICNCSLIQKTKRICM